MSQQPQPPVSTGALIAGIVVGLLVGGSVLVLLLFLLFGMLFDPFSKGNPELGFIFQYLVAIVIGIAGIAAVRRSAGFTGGLLVGLAAGLLGGSAVCNVIVGSFNTMH